MTGNGLIYASFVGILCVLRGSRCSRETAGENAGARVGSAVAP
jgi:hypothetical protein